MSVHTSIRYSFKLATCAFLAITAVLQASLLAVEPMPLPAVRAMVQQTQDNERAIATGELVPMAADVPGCGEQPFSLSVNANNEVSAQHSDSIGLLSRVVAELDAAVPSGGVPATPWAAASGAGGGTPRR